MDSPDRDRAPIDEVREAQKDGAPEEALPIALDAWRQSKAPEIADVIDLLAAETLAQWKAPKVRGNDAFQEAWLASAVHLGTPAVPWLASTLTERLPIKATQFDLVGPDFVGTRYGPLFARLTALGTHAPDPHIAAAVVAVVAEAPFTALLPQWVAAIYRPMLELIAACQDVRQVAALEALVAHPRGRSANAREVLRGLIPPTVKSLAEIKPTLDEIGRQAWRGLLTSPDSTSGGWTPPGSGSVLEAEALLEAIVERPEDDSCRLAYADLLTGHGDPRGEFITIQVASARGDLGPEAIRRGEALLREHGDAWVGDLGRVADVEFVRGFPFKLVLKANAVAATETWEGAATQKGLGTVEVLEKGRGNGVHLTSFLLSPQMRNLRCTDVFRSTDVASLCAGPPRRIEELVFLNPPSKASLRQLAKTAALPLLRQLAFADRHCMAPEPVKRLLESGVLRKVRSIRVSGGDEAHLRDLQSKLLGPGHVDEIGLI